MLSACPVQWYGMAPALTGTLRFRASETNLQRLNACVEIRRLNDAWFNGALSSAIVAARPHIYENQAAVAGHFQSVRPPKCLPDTGRSISRKAFYHYSLP